VNERIEDIGEGVDMKLDLGRAMGATHNPLLFSSLL